MTTFNGLVAIVFNLTAILASTSSSLMRPVLIHQFDDGHIAGVVSAGRSARSFDHSRVPCYGNASGPPGPAT
ncbi:MAG TPA: hypothetical protein VF590_10020, partial [Isosphaeraceae bacterium]